MKKTVEDILNEILADNPKELENNYVSQSDPESKDLSKSAQMHLINLEKKYRKGTIHQRMFEKAVSAFSNGDFEDVISMGESLRNPTAAEIREVERSFSSMEEPKTVPTALTTERIERLIRHLKS